MIYGRKRRKEEEEGGGKGRKDWKGNRTRGDHCGFVGITVARPRDDRQARDWNDRQIPADRVTPRRRRRTRDMAGPEGEPRRLVVGTRGGFYGR